MNRIQTAVLVPIILALLMTSAFLAACGGGSAKPACVVVDASESTLYAQHDYLAQLSADSNLLAGKGGNVAVAVATGAPLTESDVMTTSFEGLEGTEAGGKRSLAIASFVDDVSRAVQEAASGVSNPTKGSGIIEAVVLVARQDCGSITVLSDGFEHAAIQLYSGDVTAKTAKGRAVLIARLKTAGLVPDFRGIDLALPFGGFVPQGTDLDPTEVDSLREFWQAFTDAAGATLIWGRSAT